MTYKEYIGKYRYCFGHDDYMDGEVMTETLEELLEKLKDDGFACPEEVYGGVPVKVTIDYECTLDDIIERFQNNEFYGEDVEMPEDGIEFLKKCFKEYNEKYATYGRYYDFVKVTVPDEMKFDPYDDPELMEAKK